MSHGAAIMSSTTLQQRVDALASQGAQQTLAAAEQRQLRRKSEQRKPHRDSEQPDAMRHTQTVPRAPPAQHALYAPRRYLAGFSAEAVLVSTGSLAAGHESRPRQPS